MGNECLTCSFISSHMLENCVLLYKIYLQMNITHRGTPSSNIIDDKMNCNEPDKTDFFTGLSGTVIS